MAASAFAFQRLLEAGRVLEGREPGWGRARAGASAAGGGEHGRGADEPAEQERAQPFCPRFAVHGTIVAVICCLGDLLLDVIVRAPRPLAAGTDTAVETRVTSGGQAANVASWVAELGEQVRFIGKQADDDAGALVRSLLERRGVDLAGPRVEGSTGVVVSLVGADGDRSMATDRGIAPELRAEELDAEWLSGCHWLHLSGYSLLVEPILDAALAAASLARAEGARVSVDLSSWSAIRARGPERFRTTLEELEPDVVFANEPEWELVGGAYGLGETAVVKRGFRGVSILSAAGVEEHGAVGSDVVDTTGAGDALAAGFIVGGIELGLETAARCVAQLGAVPV
ncbi:MAG TPA: PfkB family carbohydrate kinase [Gaiellaceae bacterium]